MLVLVSPKPGTCVVVSSSSVTSAAAEEQSKVGQQSPVFARTTRQDGLGGWGQSMVEHTAKPSTH